MKLFFLLGAHSTRRLHRRNEPDNDHGQVIGVRVLSSGISSSSYSSSFSLPAYLPATRAVTADVRLLFTRQWEREREKEKPQGDVIRNDAAIDLSIDSGLRVAAAAASAVAFPITLNNLFT